MRLLARLLDPFFLRTPFERARARRYAAEQRPAFGDLDRRLADALAPDLGRARAFLDLGSGPGQLAEVIRALHPHLVTVSLDPSRTYRPDLRARAEALPLAAATIDVAVLLSSLRHVQDRVVALRELWRVLRPGGVVVVLELDPDADLGRRRRHAGAMRSPYARASFYVGLAACPPTSTWLRAARLAGWTALDVHPDPLQPVSWLWLRR